MSMVEKESNVTYVSGEDKDSSPSRLDNNHSRRNEIKLMSGSSPFKGVCIMSNGNWGAQIYVNQQRIWLGTFKSEKEAAMMYDSASMKLRNGSNLQRNFPWSIIIVREQEFQRQFDVEKILSMIKDGSYMNMFSEYLKGRVHAISPHDPFVGIMGQELFHKELTPSDVGKLNRLVIPRKFAVRYFPAICQNPDDQNGDVIQDVQDNDVHLYDIQRKLWTFRYCYWKSSQSFVFTRGWNRFVKEKGLKEKDIVVFSLLNGNHMIDIRYNYEERNNVVEDASGSGLRIETMEEVDDEENVSAQIVDYFAMERINKKHKTMLFGVEID